MIFRSIKEVVLAAVMILGLACAAYVMLYPERVGVPPAETREAE